MRRTFLLNLTQHYTHPQTKEFTEYHYQVAIIKDTEDYTYRILNTTSGTIWKDHFSTFNDAMDYLKSHSHATEKEPKEVLLDKLY